MARLSKEMTTIVIESEKQPDWVRFLQVRDEMLKALETGKYPIRVDISWAYEEGTTGMPSEALAEQMEQLEEALLPKLEKNNLALLAYQLTGDGLRLWSLYTRNIHAFEEQLNEALKELPLFPITFYAEEDIEGDAYREVSSLL